MTGRGAREEKLRAFLSAFLPAIEDIRILRHVCEGEYVATHWEVNGVFGIIPILELFRVRNGLVVEAKAFFDPKPILGRQIIMNPDHIIDHFKETDALLDGHFILSSGLHSPKYLQCALALQYPADAARFGRPIAELFVNEGIETVASPAIGGLVIGYAVAEALNVRFIWTERQDGVMTLRRGFNLKEGERVMVVEDVITTGGSTRECIAALEKHGASVVGAASIIDRSNGTADVGVPRISLASLDVPSYKPEECPLCEQGTEAVKPGSRK